MKVDMRLLYRSVYEKTVSCVAYKNVRVPTIIFIALAKGQNRENYIQHQKSTNEHKKKNYVLDKILLSSTRFLLPG